MAHSNSVFTGKPAAEVRVTDRPFLGGIGFDWLMAMLGSYFAGGIYLDGWAHDHGLVDRTFFTPWHALLYGAYAICGVTLIITVSINYWRGRSWRMAIPRGYELSLVGVPLFLVAGEGDLIWHELFGFEVGIEPLLSPTHLLLALGGILIMSGPLRAAWRRADPITSSGWARLGPALLSLLAVFSIFTFFTEFAHPFAHTRVMQAALSDEEKSWGAASVLLQTIILMGFALLALRRWRLPVGAFTFIFTLNVTLMSSLADQQRLIPGVFLAGVMVDLLYLILKPEAGRITALRLFALSVPLLYALGFFVTLTLTGGITWSIHLWLGSSVMAGIIGLLLSYLLVPPASPVTYER